MQQKNELWIEITNHKGFLMFGDLSHQQRLRGINVGINEVDGICFTCGHKLRFTKRADDTRKKRVWDWGGWRVFLRGNQVLKSKTGYYAELPVVFFCRCCQKDELQKIVGAY